MENKNMKCSQIEHGEIDAISYCQECKVYLCNKCDNFHSKLLKNHHAYNLDKNLNEIFIDLCKEENHSLKMVYFCKNHNQLCCAACIAKIKGEGNGQHTDCNVCFINDIREEKKNKLKENIKNLENLSETFIKSISELKELYDKIYKKKEELKLKIQKIFTKIRNELNNREDELLLKIDNKYENLFCNEDIIKESEKLPNKIKLSLEKGKYIKNNWNNNKLNFLINDCLIIENNISNIKLLNERIIKSTFSNKGIKFKLYEQEELNNLLNSINIFGLIQQKIKLFNSTIISEEELDLVESWLNHKKFTSELLYRKTKHGSTTNDFHNKCDNKGITITFIETTKEYKFSGYTELQWDKSEKSKKDKTTFIFSFNNKQKYKARNNNNSIGCFIDEGPRFGCGFPEIYLKHTLNKGESFDNAYCTFSQGRILTNGESSWDIKEIEVYKIIYN